MNIDNNTMIIGILTPLLRSNEQLSEAAQWGTVVSVAHQAGWTCLNMQNRSF